MNKEQVAGIVRHVLTFAGGFAIAKGWMDANLAAEITTWLVTGVTLIWSVAAKKKEVKPA